MLEILNHAWDVVADSYRREQINSERALQAALYHGLRQRCDSLGLTVLVEPGFNDYVPDLIVRDNTRIHCIIELKCTPHYYVPTRALTADIQKLLSYTGLEGSKVRLDIFGPARSFDVKAGVWNPPMPSYEVSPDTWYAFGVLTRYDDKAGSLVHIRRLAPGIGSNPRFVLMAGIMTPDATEETRCTFRVETQRL